MCGIVGIFSPTTLSTTEVDLFKGLLAVDIIRGSHATGVIKVNTHQNNVTMHKRADDAYDFLASAETKEFLGKDVGNILIGHNRYATMGDKSDHKNAHPFQEDHITMVHNGGVSLWSLDLLEGNDDPRFSVDSHMVARTIATHGIRKAVTEKLDGAFALVWWDAKERSLNFIRNAERPLYLATLPGNTLVWASEKGMLDVYLNRSSKKISQYTHDPVELDINKLISFRFGADGKLLDNKPKAEEVIFLDVPAPTISWGGWASDWASASGSANSYYGTSRSGIADYDAREIERVNGLLDRAGCHLQRGSILTIDVEEICPNIGAERFCKVIGSELTTGARVQVWGLVTEQVTGLTKIRCTLAGAYYTSVKGANTLTITGNAAGISCHDARYIHKGQNDLDLQQDILSREHAERRSEYQRESITYPLKTQGHTFKDSHEFVDFVSQGCSLCGTVPTAYNKLNRKLSVVTGNAFSGLLSECEFICGKCEEELP